MQNSVYSSNIHPIQCQAATSQTRAACKFVLSTLLPTIMLFTVSAYSYANDWTGLFTSNWFLSSNWISGIPRQTDDAIINTVTPNATIVGSSGALAQNLTVGQNGTGMLTIQDGGTLSNSLGTIGNGLAGRGMVTVSGIGSTWSNAGSVVVGGLGVGRLIIENGGTVNSGGGSIGLSADSIGSVTVTGPNSRWINGISGGLNIGSFGTGTLLIADGGKVINLNANTTNIGNGLGSQGTVTVTGAGSAWSNNLGVNIGNSGTGTLTISNNSTVLFLADVTIAANASSIGTLNIGSAANQAPVAPGSLTAPSINFGMVKVHRV